MPTLPLPPLTTGVPLDCGPLAVSQPEDVTSIYSPDIQALEVAPVRDAIQTGQYYSLLEYQKQARYAAAQSDPLRATGEYLDDIGAERGISRNTGEPDLSYRTRINQVRTVVDPEDIIAAANAVLAPFTSIQCRYAERSDGWFLAGTPTGTDGISSFESFLFVEPSPGGSVTQTSGSLSANRTPNYPARLYSTITARRPPGAMLNADIYGRWFLLRAPDIQLIDVNIANLANTQNDFVTPEDNSGLFLSNSTHNNTEDAGAFLFNFAATADQVYQSLIDAVEAIRGQSIRWELFVDPNLDS